MEKVNFNVVYNRKKKLLSNGKALVQVEAYLNGKKKYFSTNIYIEPNQWNPKTRQIKNHESQIELNRQVKILVDKMEKIELKQRLNNKPFNLEFLSNYLRGNYNESFLTFCKQEILKLKIAISTKKVHETAFAHLEKFRKSVKFEDLDYNFLVEFQQYLRGLGNISENSIFKYMTVLRRYVNIAIDKDIIDINKYPFRKFRIKKTQSERTFLTPEEIEKIENLQLPEEKKYLQLTLDKFRFSIYTGLRYSDITALRPENLIFNDGREWLYIAMQKTKEPVKIPISLLFDGRALDIYYKYVGSNKVTLFDFQYNALMNVHLKEIATLAKINKKITFHMARHTQATYLLYKGVSITTIQKLLGHRRIETTQIYGKVMDMTIVNELKNVSFSK